MTEERVDRDSPLKLYVQLHNIIKGKIERSEWSKGAYIPSEDELCRLYDVSKVTVRLAISELARDGYLMRQQGKGTVVTYSLPYLGITMKTRLTEDMFAEGVTVKREILLKGVKEVPEDIKAYLKAEESIYYILYKKVVNGDPACLGESFIPLSVFPSIENEDFLHTSLYDLIQEKAYKKISKVIQSIELVEARGDVAAILRMKDGESALLVHRLLLSSDASSIAYTRLFGSGRKYKIQMEFLRLK